MNAFEQIIQKHVGAFQKAITDDIRKMLMGGDTSKPAKARAPKTVKTPRKERTKFDPSTAEAAAYQVGQHPDGVATGVLAKELDLDKTTTAKALKLAVKNGLVKSTGSKRSTLYFASNGAGA